MRDFGRHFNKQLVCIMSKSLTSLTGDHQHYCRTCRREFEGQLLVKIRRRGVGLVARSNMGAGVRDAVTSPARGTAAADKRATPLWTSASRSVTHAWPPPRRSSRFATAGLWSQTAAGC